MPATHCRGHLRSNRAFQRASNCENGTHPRPISITSWRAYEGPDGTAEVLLGEIISGDRSRQSWRAVYFLAAASLALGVLSAFRSPSAYWIPARKCSSRGAFQNTGSPCPSEL